MQDRGLWLPSSCIPTFRTSKHSPTSRSPALGALARSSSQRHIWLHKEAQPMQHHCPGTKLQENKEKALAREAARWHSAAPELMFTLYIIYLQML